MCTRPKIKGIWRHLWIEEGKGLCRGKLVILLEAMDEVRQEESFPGIARLCLFSCSVMPDSLWPYGLQHARLPGPLLSPRDCSNSCPLSWWCQPSRIRLFPSVCLQSSLASGSFQMSQLFASSGHSIRVSASAAVLIMNIQDWFPVGWTGWICLQSKGLSRVFSNTTVQKHQFFGTQLSS